MKKVIALIMVTLMAGSVMAFHGAESRCSSCHIVHMAGDNEGVPLWNSTQTVAYDTFTEYYTGYKFEGIGTIATGPQGSTLLCLSCHDGASNHAMVPEVADGAAGPSDMSGTHPIEFVYDAALVALDNELVDPSSASGVVGSAGSIEDDLLVPGTSVMNCTSCHDIHAQGLHGQTTTVTDPATQQDVQIAFDLPHLVNIPGIQWQYNSRSGFPNTDPAGYRLIYTPLCVTCHIK